MSRTEALAKLRQKLSLTRPIEKTTRLQATGLPALDDMLGGGLPRRAIVELVGPDSAGTSGKTTLALRMLAAASKRGETCAWIDDSDAFDAPSAAARGVDLSRLLWVRAPGKSVRACDLVLEAGGFGLVVLDWKRPAPRRSDQLPAARLARRAASADATLLVMSEVSSLGTFAAVRLQTRSGGLHWRGRLFMGMSSRVRIVKARGMPEGGEILQSW